MDVLNVNVLKESLVNQRVVEDGGTFKFNLILEMIYEGLVWFSFRYDFKTEATWRVDLSPCDVSLKAFSDLEIAYSGGNKIKWPKYNDVVQLLKYIPPVYHDAYKQLQYDKAILRSTFQKMFRGFSIICYCLMC